MTLAFTFPIEDAWIIVADRLLTRSEGSLFLDGKEEKIRADNSPKIEELPRGFVFVGAGDRNLLDRFIEEINLKDSLDSFNKDFERFSSNLNTTPFSTSVNKTEFIIIDRNSLTATRYFNGKKHVVDGSMKNSFIGVTEALDLNDSKRDILRMSHLKQLSNTDICILVTNLEKLSAQRLDVIGHPAIDGCNIWEINKEKIRKIFIKPKNYSWRIQ